MYWLPRIMRWRSLILVCLVTSQSRTTIRKWQQANSQSNGWHPKRSSIENTAPRVMCKLLFLHKPVSLFMALTYSCIKNMHCDFGTYWWDHSVIWADRLEFSQPIYFPIKLGVVTPVDDLRMLSWSLQGLSGKSFAKLTMLSMSSMCFLE